MAGAEPPPPLGLWGLPDLAHAAIVGFCGQDAHLEMMSTSSAARGTFAAHLGELSNRRRLGRDKQLCGVALLGLLRRLPNLRRLQLASDHMEIYTLSPSLAAGDWCRGLVEIDLITPGDAEGDAALGAALGTGNLPMLERARLPEATGELLTEFIKGLKGGVSPRLADIECAAQVDGLVAVAEALEARMSLQCCPTTDLAFQLYDGDEDLATSRPDALRRLCSSPALTKLKNLGIYLLVDDEEVCLLTMIASQRPPQAGLALANEY
jgi:hypothetical protein